MTEVNRCLSLSPVSALDISLLTQRTSQQHWEQLHTVNGEHQGKKDVKEKNSIVGVQIVLTKSEETRILDLVQSICDDCKKATKLPGA